MMSSAILKRHFGIRFVLRDSTTFRSAASAGMSAMGRGAKKSVGSIVDLPPRNWRELQVTDHAVHLDRRGVTNELHDFRESHRALKHQPKLSVPAVHDAVAVLSENHVGRPDIAFCETLERPVLDNAVNLL